MNLLDIIHSVADSRPPPQDQIFFNFMRFFRDFDKDYMLAPPAGGLAPPLTEILDPPLTFIILPRFAVANNCLVFIHHKFYLPNHDLDIGELGYGHDVLIRLHCQHEFGEY